MRGNAAFLAFLVAGCGPSWDGAGPPGGDDDGADDDGADDDGADDDGADDDGADDDATEPESLAGTYHPALLSYEVTTPSDVASVRSSPVAWDPVTGAFVVVYGWVEDGRFRTRAVALDWDGAGLRTSEHIQVEVVVATQDSLEREVAAATGDESRLLAVWEDTRLGNGWGYREVYGRFLTVGEGPTLAPVGEDFPISGLPDLEEYLPAVAWDEGAGLFYVAWSDDRDGDPDGRRLFGRTVGRDGSLGPEARLGPETSYWQVGASVAGSGGRGRFLVVWGDFDLPGGSIDAGYRARVVDGAMGQPVSEVITLTRYGDLLYDRPAVAWQPWAGGWLVAWTLPYTVRSSWISFDGELLSTGDVLVDDELGAGMPFLAYAPATHSFALTYHSWWSYDAWLQELDPQGRPVGEATSVNAATPWLGTFWQPVAASGTEAEVLAVPSIDYQRITASVFLGGD
ncbi:hypothetical protein L6R50_22910 [Myxococcota bacterium]|nr:hypothetical protein [Myxococcota bacterium]